MNSDTVAVNSSMQWMELEAQLRLASALQVESALIALFIYCPNLENNISNTHSALEATIEFIQLHIRLQRFNIIKIDNFFLNSISSSILGNYVEGLIETRLTSLQLVLLSLHIKRLISSNHVASFFMH